MPAEEPEITRPVDPDDIGKYARFDGTDIVWGTPAGGGVDPGLVGDLSTIEIGDAASAGVAGRYADAAHQHALAAPAAPAELGASALTGAATAPARADHVHPYPTAAQIGAAASGHAHSGVYDPAGAAAAAVAAHGAVTTSVHGIPDTAALLDTADIGVTVQAHRPEFGPGLTGAAIFAALPNFVAAITSYDDHAASTISVVSVGSSVGQGATLADPSADAPSAYLTTAIGAAVNKLGNITFEHVNGCAAGHTLADSEGDYATAVATATGDVALVPVVFGMNDGNTDIYHNGQTYPGVRTFLRQLVADIKADDADPVVFTSPHPHTGRQTWTASLGNVYPSGGRVPADNAGASIVSITTSSGDTVPASYRHLRVNEMIRRTCAELGVCVIDAERYWFEAVADNGEDALFDVGEVVHPNLLGHQLSYHAAIDHFVSALDAARLTATTPPPSNVTADEQFNVQVASPLQIRTLKDKEYGLLLVRARHPGFGGSHAAHAFLVLGETATGGRALDLGGIQGGGSNDLVTVSVSSYQLTLTATIDGMDIAWTYTRGFPL